MNDTSSNLRVPEEYVLNSKVPGGHASKPPGSRRLKPHSFMRTYLKTSGFEDEMSQKIKTPFGGKIQCHSRIDSDLPPGTDFSVIHN